MVSVRKGFMKTFLLYKSAQVLEMSSEFARVFLYIQHEVEILPFATSVL